MKDYAILMLDEAGHVISWNSGAENILRYASDEIIGKHFSVFYTEEDRQARHPDDELLMARQTGRFEEEAWRVNKQGGTFWADVVVTPLWNRDGTLRGFSYVTRDISERKRAEELMNNQNAQLAEANQALRRQTARAEELNRAKRDFLATMSHEIRTPMNAILGMADLLWETELSAQQREYVGRFRRAGANLLTLINDILDISKIESGRFELESVDFDLLDVVDRTMELMAPRAHGKHLELSARVMPGTHNAVTGDPARLQQILNNLIGNAIKFTEAGMVALTVSNHPDGQPGHLKFAVSDTGIGIAAGKMTAIFEDFTQAESSTTRRFGGTGLGLGISRRLVSRMGGELTVQSAIGKGSTFRFDVVLPIAERPVATESEELPDLSGRRVLIVDDNATNRLILSEMCAGWGMATVEANTPAQAGELVRQALQAQNAFSLVLLDRVMPKTEGLEALQHLRELDPDLPVVLASSDNQPGDVTRAKALGAAAYLMKPVRQAELLRVVSSVLRGEGRETESRERLSGVTPARETSMRILIAEDSDDNRFLIAAYLEDRPYELTFVENGKEACESFASRNFDLVLMDIQMPVMDGLTATTCIRDLERERSLKITPVVGLTANALVEDTQRSAAAGCNAHLSKPISKEKLVATIESFRAAGSTPRENSEHVPSRPEYVLEIS